MPPANLSGGPDIRRYICPSLRLSLHPGFGPSVGISALRYALLHGHAGVQNYVRKCSGSDAGSGDDDGVENDCGTANNGVRVRPRFLVSLGQ